MNRVKVGERRSERMKCKNVYNRILSRVRVRTRNQEFLCFCCHKCHSILCKYLFPRLLCYVLRHILTKREDYAPNSDENNGEKRVFCSIVVQHFPSFSFDFLPTCDTCDSKKSTSLLEGAQVRIRVKNPIAVILQG